MGKWPIRDAMRAKREWEDACDRNEADWKARGKPGDDWSDPNGTYAEVCEKYDDWQAARKEMWR